MKRTAEEVRIYRKTAEGVVTTAGAVPYDSSSSYEYCLQTKAGPLLISIGDDCCICTRFEDLSKVATLDLGDRLNEFSGKWNWMGGFNHAGDMYDLAQFARALRKVTEGNHSPA